MRNLASLESTTEKPETRKRDTISTTRLFEQVDKMEPRVLLTIIDE